MAINSLMGLFFMSLFRNQGITWSKPKKTVLMQVLHRRINKISGRLILVWNRMYPKVNSPTRLSEEKKILVPASWQREELAMAFSDDDGKTDSTRYSSQGL